MTENCNSLERKESVLNTNVNVPNDCPVCGAIDIFKVRDYVNDEFPSSKLFSEMAVFCCLTCGFGFSWPEISDQAVQEFYVQAYRDPASPLCIDFERLKRPFRHDPRSMSQLLLASQYADFKEGDCFLDIGPGSGASFDSAMDILPKPSCAAVELSSGAAQAYARVYQIATYGSVDEFIGSGLKAKICLMSHSLEHYKSSWFAKAMSELRNAMDDEGILIIEVPLVDLRRHAAAPLGDAPHFSFFSTDSLERLLAKLGWEVRFIDSCAETYEQWISHKHSMNSLGASASGSWRRLVRRMSGMLPEVAQTLIHRVRLGQGSDTGNPNFCYGGDRTCLRVVAVNGKVG